MQRIKDAAAEQRSLTLYYYLTGCGIRPANNTKIKTMNKMNQDELLRHFDTHPKEYDTRQLMGREILIVTRDKSQWLYHADKEGKRRMIPLVEDGQVMFLTENDIEERAVRLIKKECPGLMLKARFRFWVFPFKDGRTAVEWTVQPDGCYYGDSDGFGMTDDVEISLHGYIDTEGRPAGKFVLRD